MTNTPTADQQVEAMLARGWRWRDAHSTVLVHPQDHGLSATYDRAAGTLTLSAALVEALNLVILTPAGQNPKYWRDDQKDRARPRKG